MCVLVCMMYTVLIPVATVQISEKISLLPILQSQKKKRSLILHNSACMQMAVKLDNLQVFL
jgi:hypothetical protein